MVKRCSDYLALLAGVFLPRGRHSDAPAFNSEQQLCRERHMAGKSCHWGLEHRGQLDCGWPAQWARGHGNVRVLQYNRRLPRANTEVDGIITRARAPSRLRSAAGIFCSSGAWASRTIQGSHRPLWLLVMPVAALESYFSLTARRAGAMATFLPRAAQSPAHSPAPRNS